MYEFMSIKVFSCKKKEKKKNYQKNHLALVRLLFYQFRQSKLPQFLYLLTTVSPQ